MTVEKPPNAKTDLPGPRGRDARRIKRTVRFSDPEWQQVQKAAERRGITASDYVRGAALNLVDHDPQPKPGGLSPALIEIIKLTHRSAYILSTLKRDEMISEGRGREMDELVRAARIAQADILASQSSHPSETDT